MEAERLIEVGRRALADSTGAMEIMAEAWQVQALARAVGGRLVLSGPAELRGEARGLSEIVRLAGSTSAGDHVLVDPSDPFPEGYLLPDTWPGGSDVQS